MGRFYKTNQTAPIDWIERNPNIQLMAAMAIANQDANIDNQINEAKLLGSDLAKTPYLEKDRDLATGKINQLNEKVTNLTNGIMKDPAKWREKLGELRDLKNEIHKEYTTGVLGNVGKNYNTAQQKFKELDERVAKGNVSAVDANLWKAMYMQKYEGAYDPKTNTYKPFNWEDITDHFDLNKFIEETIKGIKPDAQEIVYDNISGGYNIKTKNGWEKISKRDVYDTVQNALAGNTEALQYFKQRQSIGVVNNVVDENGNLRPTFEVHTVPILDAQGNPTRNQLTGEYETEEIALPLVDNVVARTIASHIAKDAYTKKDIARELKADEWALQNDKQAHDLLEQSRDFAQQRKMAELKHAQDKEKFEWENSNKPNAENTWTESVQTGVDENGKPIMTDVEKTVKYNTETHNPDGSPKVKTNTSLTNGYIPTLIPTFKSTGEFVEAMNKVTNSKKELTEKLKNPKLNPTQISDLNKQLQDLSIRSADLLSIYHNELSNPKVLKMSDNTYKLGMNYYSNKDILNKKIQEAKNNYLKYAKEEYYNQDGSENFRKNFNEYTKLVNEYKLGEKAYSEINRKRNDFLLTNSKNNVKKIETVSIPEGVSSFFNDNYKRYPLADFRIQNPKEGGDIFKGVNNFENFLQVTGKQPEQVFKITELGSNGMGIATLQEAIGGLKVGDKIPITLPIDMSKSMAENLNYTENNPKINEIIDNNKNINKLTTKTILQNGFTNNLSSTGTDAEINIPVGTSYVKVKQLSSGGFLVTNPSSKESIFKPNEQAVINLLNP